MINAGWGGGGDGCVCVGGGETRRNERNSHDEAAENAVFGLDSGYVVPRFSCGWASGPAGRRVR